LHEKCITGSKHNTEYRDIRTCVLCHRHNGTYTRKYFYYQESTTSDNVQCTTTSCC